LVDIIFNRYKKLKKKSSMHLGAPPVRREGTTGGELAPAAWCLARGDGGADRVGLTDRRALRASDC
jgi:hypothetical protein